MRKLKRWMQKRLKWFFQLWLTHIEPLFPGVSGIERLNEEVPLVLSLIIFMLGFMWLLLSGRMDVFVTPIAMFLAAMGVPIELNHLLQVIACVIAFLPFSLLLRLLCRPLITWVMKANN